jgi:hypothetical protein
MEIEEITTPITPTPNEIDATIMSAILKLMSEEMP